jgi:hypothetical protein
VQGITLSTADGASAAAIHDTVSAIVRQSAYDRSLRQSLAELVFRWLGDMIDRFLGVIAVPGTRRVATVLAVLVVLLVVARFVYAARLRSDGDHARGSRGGVRHGTAADPLGEAERLAAEGRYTEAAHALYRALLVRLSRRERLRLHPSKTSGEYARELQAIGSPSHVPFRRFGRQYDRVLFRGSGCDAASYAFLLDQARSLLQTDRPAGDEPRGRAA